MARFYAYTPDDEDTPDPVIAPGTVVMQRPGPRRKDGLQMVQPVDPPGEVVYLPLIDLREVRPAPRPRSIPVVS